MAPRPLTEAENAVLHCLLRMSQSEATPHVSKNTLVEEIQDGGMGSLRFVDNPRTVRRMGSELVTAEYIDDDEILVSISVNLDEHGELFEMDFWKVDFSPLRRYPRPEELHSMPPSISS